MKKRNRKLKLHVATIKRKVFTAVLEKEKKWIVALCPELDVVSQGRTYDEALDNLREAVRLYLEYADPSEYKDMGTPLITTFAIAA